MFSPPKLTVLRCKRAERGQLEQSIERLLPQLYEKRFMSPPPIVKTNEDNVVCVENRIDEEVRPQRHPCDIKNYDEQVVIVDANCGAAVLRGADIFAPGVVTCTETFVGDIVGIWCDLANERRTRESKKGPKFVLKGARFPIPEEYRVNLIFMGLGRIIIPRVELFCEKPIESGVAVETYRPVIDAPPFSDAFIHEQLDVYAYLQNYGSIQICNLLLDGIDKDASDLTVTDMCAAPGGKTSVLLDGLNGQYNRFIAVDRKTRVSSLEFELSRYDKGHTVEIVNGDSTKLDFIADSSVNVILLDAPCSATGSRPKPTNEAISERQVKSYQKLQRKLIAEAVRILAPGGHMVYSTCSVLDDENEANRAFIEQKFECMKSVGCVQYNPFERSNRTANGLTIVENENALTDTIGFYAVKFVKE